MRARPAGLQNLRGLTRPDLTGDLVAGIVLTAFLIPVGMGYSQAAGLPPVHGLYATVLPLLAYAVFGPSRILVLGPDSSLAPLIAVSILPLADGDTGRAIALAGALAIGVGIIALAAGFAHFGFVTELLSMPVRVGYLNGIAVVVILSQLPKMLGVTADSDAPLGQLIDLIRAIGEMHGETAAFGVGALIGLIILRRVFPALPRSLVVVVVSIIAVELFGASDRLDLVGALSSGFPVPSVPLLQWSDLDSLVVGSLTIALVTFADTSVLSKAYSERQGQTVDPDSELIGVGAANIAAGFFQGFPISASSSRTPVAEAAGAKSQLTGVVSAVLIVLLLVAAPGLLGSLPLSTLAAIVIVAVFDLIDIVAVSRLARWRRREFVLSMIAFVGVVAAGVVWGIGLAVAVSLLAFVNNAWRPHVTSLVRIDGVSGYHDINRHPEGGEIDGLLLFRFDAPLFFANADGFRTEVLERVDHTTGTVHWVVVTAEPITDIDATAEAVLVRLHADLKERGITLAFAELKGVVKDQITQSGTVELIGAHRLFPTIGEAVAGYVAESGVPWTDWKERKGET